MNRLRRAWLGVFTWQGVGPFIAATLTALLVALFIDQHQGRVAAEGSLGTARTLASQRITVLLDRIDHLSHQLADASKDKGKLVAKIEALTNQLRQLGATPVVTVHQTPAPTSRSPSPTRTTKVIVRPTVTATRTKTPRPSPSPHPVRSLTCVLLPTTCP